MKPFTKVGQGSHRDDDETSLDSPSLFWGMGGTFVTNKCHIFGWKLLECYKIKC